MLNYFSVLNDLMLKNNIPVRCTFDFLLVLFLYKYFRCAAPECL